MSPHIMGRPIRAGFLALSLVLIPGGGQARHDAGPPAPTLRITEIERMNWGTVAIPSSGSQVLELSALTSTIKGSGSLLFGTPQRGVYRLSACNDCRGAIVLDIANVSSGSQDFTLDHFEGVFASTRIREFPSQTLQAPDAHGVLLYLGARATVNAGMRAQNLEPTFDIDVIMN